MASEDHIHVVRVEVGTEFIEDCLTAGPQQEAVVDVSTPKHNIVCPFGSFRAPDPFGLQCTHIEVSKGGRKFGSHGHTFGLLEPLLVVDKKKNCY